MFAKTVPRRLPNPAHRVEKSAGGISTAWYCVLKWIALITMFIDHYCKFMYALGRMDGLTCIIGIAVGRIAFPLYAFLLVECSRFTKNKLGHIAKLWALAYVSEYPYNIAFVLKSPFLNVEAVENNAMLNQNVIWELLIGFIMLTLLHKDWKAKGIKIFKNEKVALYFSVCCKANIIALSGLAAELWFADYEWSGILFIAILDFARERKHTKVWQAVAFIIFYAQSNEPFLYVTISVALALIYFAESENKYNKIEGNFEKFITSKISLMICRYFYPLHIIAFAIARCIMF